MLIVVTTSLCVAMFYILTESNSCRREKTAEREREMIETQKMRTTLGKNDLAWRQGSNKKQLTIPLINVATLDVALSLHLVEQRM